MPIPFWQRPQRVTPEQWEEIREHYEEDVEPEDLDEFEEEPEMTDDARNREIRQRMLDSGRWPWKARGAPKPTGTSDEEWYANRAYNRKDEPPPPEFDHDRRFMDKYDQDNGDIGDDGDPPY